MKDTALTFAVPSHPTSGTALSGNLATANVQIRIWQNKYLSFKFNRTLTGKSYYFHGVTVFLEQPPSGTCTYRRGAKLCLILWKWISNTSLACDHEVIQGCQGQEACSTPHSAGGTWYSPENRNLSTSAGRAPEQPEHPTAWAPFWAVEKALSERHSTSTVTWLWDYLTSYSKRLKEQRIEELKFFLQSSISDFPCTCFYPCFPWWETSKLF